jgi:hypothetical protein
MVIILNFKNMKKKLLIVLIISLFYANYSFSQNSSTPKSTAKGVVECLKTQNFDCLCSYIPTVLDMEAPVNNSTLEKDRKERYLKKWERAEKHRLEMKIKFFRILNGYDSNDDGDKILTNWENAEIIDVKYLIEEENPFPYADKIYIVILCNNLKYGLTLDDCIKCERGWLPLDNPRFHLIKE